MKIAFFGSPDFALPSLEILHNSKHEIVVVVTKPDMPKGRKKILQPTIVKKRALELELPVLTPDRLSLSFIEELNRYKPDYLVVVAYGKLIGPTLLKTYKDRVINLHPSMLPHLRGASPIQSAIIEGLKETGITIMHLAEKLDSGDIIAQKPFPIRPDVYIEELHDSLAHEGGNFLLETLNLLEMGRATRTPQDEFKATFCKPIEKNDGKINWSEPAIKIERLVRAYHPWPGAFTNYNNKTIKLHRVKIVEDGPHSKYGEIIRADDSGILVSTGKDSILITSLQPATKKIMDVASFLRGNKVVTGTQFS